MANFDDFVKSLENGVKKLAKDIFDGLETEAIADTQAFLSKMKSDIERWAKLLVEGKLTEKELSDLVDAKKALVEIHTLRLAGAKKAKLEKFRTELISLVINTAIKVFS